MLCKSILLYIYCFLREKPAGNLIKVDIKISLQDVPNGTVRLSYSNSRDDGPTDTVQGCTTVVWIRSITFSVEQRYQNWTKMFLMESEHTRYRSVNV